MTTTVVSRDVLAVFVSVGENLLLFSFFFNAQDAADFVVPPGGGAQGGDPITSPGLEGVFIDSGTRCQER